MAVYMVERDLKGITNDQLADMVRRRVNTQADLEGIAGVGEVRGSKYGPQFLGVLQAAGGNREASGQSA